MRHRPRLVQQPGGGRRHRDLRDAGEATFVGSLRLDLLLAESFSLKEKRSVVRPVVADLARRYGVSVAETGDADLHRRAEIGVGVVGGDAGHCRQVLEACERLVADRPELQVLSARLRVWSDEDD